MVEQTLYRKYRPLTFDDVKGQDVIVQTLKNQIKYGTNVQSYLFCGTRGTGKTSVAKIFARAINCENKQEGNPCNECDICKSIFNETNPDVYEIDAASNSGVENIRQIKRDVAYPPKMSKYRVYIIDEVHSLSKDAFNALLKTLEEPPEYVIFILATTDPQALPNTILSRCQRYEFNRINKNTIIENLKSICKKETIEADDAAIEEIALRAEGSMRDAISFLDRLRPLEGQKITLSQVKKVFGESDTTEYKKVVDAFYNEDIETALMLLKDSLNQGKEVTVYLNGLLGYLRNLLIAGKTQNSERFIEASKESYELIKEQSKNIDHSFIIRIIFLLSDAAQKIKSDTSKRILLETTFIKICLARTENTNNAIQARLASLERIVGSMRGGNFVAPVGKEGTGSSVQNVSAPAADVPAQAEEPYVNTVVLPKENIDVYRAVQKDWITITSNFGGAFNVVLRDSDLIPDKDSPTKLKLKINHPTYIDMLVQGNVKEKLEEICKKRYGWDINFDIIENYDIKQDYNYVTEEDLKKINFDVDIKKV